MVSLQNGKCSFIFKNVSVHAIKATISTKNRSSTSVNVRLSIQPLLVHKIILTISIIPQQFSNLPPFADTHPNNLTKIFSLTQRFCYFSLCQRTRDLGNLVKSDTILISYFFLKVSKVIAGLTITDFFLQRFRILMYCWCIKSYNPTHLIPSIYCHYFQTLLIPPQEFTFF